MTFESRRTRRRRRLSESLAALLLACAMGTASAAGLTEEPSAALSPVAEDVTVGAMSTVPVAQGLAGWWARTHLESEWLGRPSLKTSFLAAQSGECLDADRARPESGLALADALHQTNRQQEGLVDYVSRTFKVSVDLASRIVMTAYREASFVGVSPFLVLAVIEKESSFQPGARSPVGAVGLMQVMAKYHAQRFSTGGKRVDLAHPETNIKVGSTILREYLDASKGNLKQALSRYSGGTKGYAGEVLSTYGRLKAQQDGSR